LTIKINAQPDATVQAYAVSDTPPAGWPVAAISHGGQYDPVNATVKWGPFTDNQHRTLTYSTTPSAGAAGSFLVSGEASFDGVHSGTPGVRRFEMAQRLKINTPSLQRSFGFHFIGEVGRRYVVEMSSDLVTWTAVTTLTQGEGELQFTEVDRPSSKQRFYRTRLAE
jgi:hypothetical protein